MSTTFEISGECLLEELDKDKNRVAFMEYKNLITYCGLDFIMSLLSRDYDDYYDDIGSPHLHLAYMALGSSPSTNDGLNRGVSINDWKLSGEGDPSNQYTLRAPISSFTKKKSSSDSTYNDTLEVIATFPGTIFPYDNYKIYEAGTFLGDTPPSTNPMEDSSQKPYSMFNRIVFDPPYVKQSAANDLRVTWRLKFSSREPQILFEDDFDNGSVSKWHPNSYSTVEIESSTYQSPPYCGKFISTNSPNYASISSDVFSEPVSSGVIWVNFYIYIPSGSDNEGIVALSNSPDWNQTVDTGVVVYFAFNNDVYYVTPGPTFNKIGEFEKGKWYGVSMRVDVDSQTFNITVTRLGDFNVIVNETNLSFYDYSAAHPIKYFAVVITLNNATCYIDSVRVVD